MRLKQPRGVFFTLGEQHHDLAVLEVPPGSDDPKMDQVGLHHFAMQVEDFEALKDCYRTLKSHVFPSFERWTTGLRKASTFVIQRVTEWNCIVMLETMALLAYANKANSPSWIFLR